MDDPKDQNQIEDHQPPETPATVSSGRRSNGKLGRLTDWWRQLPRVKQVVYGGAATVVVALVVIILTPLRYPVVGLFHKGTVTLTVVDDKTHQPIPDAQAGVGSHADITDKNGQVTLHNLPLGKLTVTINKHAYATTTVHTTVFLSSRQLGEVAIHSTGVLVKFGVTDWVSSKPVKSAKVTIGESSATTDEQGSASVSLDPQAVPGAKAVVSAEGFNDNTVAINKAVSKTNQVSMVPAGSLYFFSNRSGRIDLYRANVDGSSQTVVLKGTGTEDAATGLLPSIHNQNELALVSSRAGKHNNYGGLDHDLYLFTGGSNKLTKLDGGVQFTDFRAWIGSSLVWVKNDSSGSTATIKSYDIKTKATRTLLQATKPDGEDSYLSISGLGVSGQNLYYNLTSSDVSQSGFYSVGLSAAVKRLDSGSVDQAYRLAKDSLVVSLSGPQYTNVVWKKLTFASGSLSNLPGEPATESNRGYADSPDGRYSSYIETRDGQSQLYLTNADGSHEKPITTSGKVNQFVQWYGGRYIAYSSTEGSSIYIVSIDGGTEKKITDFFKGNGKTYGGGYNPAYFLGAE